MTDTLNIPEALDDWAEQAACKGKTHLFFVNRGDTTRMNHAKAICKTCPVLESCRNYVLYHPERFGIWAGMTEKDRRQYRLDHGIKLPAAQHGTRTRYNSGCRCLPCRTVYNSILRIDRNRR